MLRRGRPTSDDFASDENLFFRWFSNWLNGTELNPNNVPYADQSVNRQDFQGRPWHVLLPEPPKNPAAAESSDERAIRQKTLHMGIVQLKVGAIPAAWENSGFIYRFAVAHDPLDNNYGHCEIRIYQNEKRMTKDQLGKNPGKMAKKFYRTEIAAKARLSLFPEIGTKGSQ